MNYVQYNITDWIENEIKGIKLSRSEDIRNFCSGTTNLYDGLREAVQISAHKLETITSKYGQKISKSTTKQWFIKEEIQRSIIIIIIIIIIIWNK